MLVLSRRVGESIRIGDDIEISIVEIRDGTTIKLGISAPRDVTVLRSELLETTEENKSAMHEVTPDMVRRLLGSIQSSNDNKK